MRFGFAQTESPFDLVPEESVFRRELLVAKEEFLVNRVGDIREQSFPIHRRK